jgi:hypothetical protein
MPCIAAVPARLESDLSLERTTGFEVADHDELPERGGFVIGHLRSVLRCGELVRSPADPAQVYTIAAIEFLSGNGQHRQALIFSDKPSLSEVRRAFPVGSLVVAD